MEPSDWIIIGIVAFVVVVACSMQFYGTFLTEMLEEYSLERTLKLVVDELWKEIEKMPRYESWQRLAVLPFYSDRDNKITSAIAQRLDNKERFKVFELEYQKELLDEYFGLAFNTNDRISAVNAGKKLAVNMVIFGEVVRFYEDDHAAETVIHYQLAKVPFGDVDLQGSISKKIKKSLLSADYYRLRLEQTSFIFRSFLWAILCISLPFLCYPLIYRIFQLESNTINAMTWICLVIVNIIFALFLNGFILFSGLWPVILLCALALSLVYNYIVLNALYG